MLGQTDDLPPGEEKQRHAEEREKAKNALKHPFVSLKEKLKGTHLHELKIEAQHLKHKIGKLENLFNPNHRHDEAHEQATDDKRTRIAEGHRFQSFAPERDGNKIKWYVDGRDYFYAVSVALEQAKEVVYIEDWWLSPELFLRRPPVDNDEWRLDQVLKRAAERGVQIYVMVYKEVTQALTCNSAHTKRSLQSLCKKGEEGYGNIRVMRHPDHNVFENFGDMTFYWAHHEKFIVIDYDLAFIGGLDACFGRWDMHHHPLADMHPLGVAGEVWPGQDWNNNRVADFQKVEDWKDNAISKADYARMPWHDVSMGVVGPCVYDIAEHFVLRWNFCKRDKYKRDDRYDWLTLQGRGGEDEDLVAVQRPQHPVGEYIEHPLSPLDGKTGRPAEDNNQGTVHAQVVRSSADWSSGILTEHSIQNAYCEVIQNAKHYVYIENQFFITATGDQQAPVHNQIGRAIADACIRAGKEGRKFRVILLIPAVPGFAGDLRDDAAMGTRAIMDYQFKSINRGEHSIFGQIKAAGLRPEDYVFVFNLRSYDRLNRVPAIKEQEERSGVKYSEVEQAQAHEMMPEGMRDHHKPHIKNRFDGDIKDDTVSDRQKKKMAEKKRRFEDKAEEVGLTEDKIKSVDSIAKDAMLDQPKPSEEVWAEEDPETEKENFVQEELYIHSKVCIVDDETVICGSSNINDRSQLGYHDSELSIVMTDTDKLSSRMDGHPYPASRHAATLRRFLWREHLGLLPAQPLDAASDPNAQPPGAAPNAWHEGDEHDALVADPLSDELWEAWTARATANTEVFRRLFHADPDDDVKTYADYEQFLPKGDRKTGHLFDMGMGVGEVRRELDRVKGHLVWMQLDFLRDAEMAEKGLQLNSYTESIYT